MYIYLYMCVLTCIYTPTHPEALVGQGISRAPGDPIAEAIPKLIRYIRGHTETYSAHIYIYVYVCPRGPRDLAGPRVPSQRPYRNLFGISEAIPNLFGMYQRRRSTFSWRRPTARIKSSPVSSGDTTVRRYFAFSCKAVLCATSRAEGTLLRVDSRMSPATYAPLQPRSLGHCFCPPQRDHDNGIGEKFAQQRPPPFNVRLDKSRP